MATVVTNRGEPEYAVLIPLLVHGGEECILLTKRPETLSSYSGQVSLPGGARDPDDEDLAATALRETHEEVGIAPTAVDLLAELDWHLTAKAHRVKPFLGRVMKPYTVQPSASEVERILYLPRGRLTKELFEVRGTWQAPNGTEHTVYTFEVDGYEVWGLTARILRSLTQLTL